MSEKRISKDEANYRISDNGQQRCGTCSMFVSPAGCSLVDGAINPVGVCDYWEARNTGSGGYTEKAWIDPAGGEAVGGNHEMAATPEVPGGERGEAISQAHHEDSVAYNLAHAIRHIEEAQRQVDLLDLKSSTDPKVVSALKDLETQRGRVKDLLSADEKKTGGKGGGGYPEPFALIKGVAMNLGVGAVSSDKNGLAALLYNINHATKHIDKAQEHSDKISSGVDEDEVEAESKRLGDVEDKVSKELASKVILPYWKVRKAGKVELEEKPISDTEKEIWSRTGDVGKKGAEAGGNDGAS